MDATEVKGSIKGKLLGGVLAVEVLITLLFAGVLVATFRANLAANALAAVERSHGAYDQIFRSDTKMLSAAIDSFAINVPVRQLYADHEKDKLQSAVKGLYENNKSRYGITHFYFIDKDGTCFLRVHKPEQSGDRISRPTFVKAASSGAIASGIELGKTAFALRVVSPYFHAGALVGFVEMGEEIDHFDRLVKEEAGVDVGVLVEKKLLDPADYRAGHAAAGREDDWNDLADYALVSTTVSDRREVAAGLSEADLHGIKGATYLGTTSRGGRQVARGAFPLDDGSGRQVGVVMVLSDVTEQVAGERRALALLAVIALLIFVLTFAAAAWFLREQVIRPLTLLSEQAIQISMGSVDKKLETTRTDEIGVLIHSFERMRVSLKKSLAMLTRKAPEPPKA